MALHKFSVRGVGFFVPKEKLSACTSEEWIFQEVLDRDLEFFQVVHDFLNKPASCRAGCIECLVDPAEAEVTLRCADGSSMSSAGGILQGPPKHPVIEVLCKEPCPVKQVRLQSGEKRELKWRSLVDGEKQILFLDDVVPVHDFQLPDCWLEPDKEKLFWQEMSFYQIFSLEMSMWSAILQKLLKVYFADGPRLHSWPGRDRHQLWASLWLALRFQVQRIYSPVELRWMVANHLENPSLPLITAVQSELFRRGFLEECEPTGVRLSISGVKWVLDGDKFFRSRKADLAGKAWWQLPLNSQHLLLSPGPVAGDTTSLLPSGPVCGFLAYRVVFLSMNFKEEELESFSSKVSCHFRHREGPAATTPCWGLLTEAAMVVPFVSHCLLDDVICVECDVASENQLPPLRIDGQLAEPRDGKWWVLACQAMPTTEEICSHGRSAARCFLPRAVAVVSSSEASEQAKESFAHAREALQAQQLCNFMANQRLKQWPSKGKVQRLAALWLILHFEPGRGYTELEVDWIIATGHNLAAKVPDCARIRKDLERTGFICREAGGKGFHLKADMVAQLLAA